MNSNFAEKFLIRNTYTWLVEIVRYYWLGLFYIVGCILHLYFNTYFVINLLYCYVYVHVANGLTGAGQVCSRGVTLNIDQKNKKSQIIAHFILM